MYAGKRKRIVGVIILGIADIYFFLIFKIHTQYFSDVVN